jgi:NAD-dependent DNA ligase
MPKIPTPMPCPFCGAKPKVDSRWGDDITIECHAKKCPAFGVWVSATAVEIDPIGTKRVKGKTRALAISRWNTRA